MIMKQYVIDDIRYEDHARLKAALESRFDSSGVEGLFWVPLPLKLMTPVQAAHEDCHPLYFSIELQEDRLSCELLVRTRERMRCDCMGYATEAQRNWLIDLIDGLFVQLEIIN